MPVLVGDGRAQQGNQQRLNIIKRFVLNECFRQCEAVLRRAVENLPGADDEKIGLIYWLARALEAQLRRPEALGFYERALAVDIRFLDIGDRVLHLGSERT